MKIKVLYTGEVLINSDIPISIGELFEKLHQIKELHGVVWYYRENPENMPNEVADEIFRKILDMKLVLSLSSKPDFSDWIGKDGKPHPRVG